MRIWNCDGGEVESCGNATRCVVQLTGAKNIDTAGGILSGEQLGEEVEISLPEPRFGWDEIPLAYAMDTAAPCRWLGTGSNIRWRSMSATRTSCSSCPMHARCRWRTWAADRE